MRAGAEPLNAESWYSIVDEEKRYRYARADPGSRHRGGKHSRDERILCGASAEAAASFRDAEDARNRATSAGGRRDWHHRVEGGGMGRAGACGTSAVAAREHDSGGEYNR